MQELQQIQIYILIAYQSAMWPRYPIPDQNYVKKPHCILVLEKLIHVYFQHQLMQLENWQQKTKINGKDTLDSPWLISFADKNLSLWHVLQAHSKKKKKKL